MSYIVLSDLLKEISSADLARLTGDPLGQTIDQQRFDYAAANADAVINSALYGRYLVPFGNPCDAIIRFIAAGLALANLFDYEYRDGILPEVVAVRRRDALNMLSALQKGQIFIPGSKVTVNAPPPLLRNSNAATPLFTDDLLDEITD